MAKWWHDWLGVNVDELAPPPVQWETPEKKPATLDDVLAELKDMNHETKCVGERLGCLLWFIVLGTIVGIIVSASGGR
jgi:hypothetical protein